VAATAKAGFGNRTLDAVLVIDNTSTMSDDGSCPSNPGCPLLEAKNAAINFKNILLGNTPSGNVVVGLAPFRGCYRASTPSVYAPNANGVTGCVSNDLSATGGVHPLTYNSSNLSTEINGIPYPGGGSKTNICQGLSKGWEILEGTGNHTAEENNARYLVLLSDGDNHYDGSIMYQTSPYASPYTYQTKSCMPPSSCSNVGGESSSASDPCKAGTYPGLTAISDSFSSTFTSGSGWTAAAWTANSQAFLGGSSPTPQGGSWRLDLGRNSGGGTLGTVSRQFSLATYTTASVSYYVRDNSSFGSSDTVCVQISTNGTSWTNLRKFGGSTCSSGSGTPTNGSWSDSAWTQQTDNLNSYAGQSTLYLRFIVQAMDNATDHFYIDTISFGGSGSPNGYLNGDDASNSCGSPNVKRKRQLEILTWEMAKAIEADDIEIYVVAFGVCSNTVSVCGDGVCTDAECNTAVGNTDTEPAADLRLLKCIASSTAGTNDHYFYASTASSLPTIFTAIAQQIAHRLIE
jgi:hypothetical protein